LNQGIEELSQFGLAGKVAIVTGAASGIGAATARLFAKVGAKVVIADIDVEGGRGVADEIASYGEAIAVHADVSDEESVAAAVARAAESFGALDVMVANAAYRPKADFLSLSVAEWDIMHAVIARGTFLCDREAIRQMRRQGSGGAIVNISSVSAVHPTILNNVHYDSAKAGVEGITRATAYEFARDNIRVNAVRPGSTNTASPKRVRNPDLAVGGPLSDRSRIPIGPRQADPLETARAVLFLASPASSYITGQFLAVDGGFLIS
jgi:NAD(P)-dependent dehydrogenase (short-subunit alcohol dehydrogenase family)